ncbi:unnamed protein product [Darwinula stevensoni]|uniref:Uncharacterized protein n=1 Tax=Darwinula stevensoni TaxID=69355 RepID=A0A7R8XC52_9CRUS|nr:unnamed protein product [Darwinula stevensoni]CAG0887149.1 unnamed protein product [Darwinula stevensoni]
MTGNIKFRMGRTNIDSSQCYSSYSGGKGCPCKSQNWIRENWSISDTSSAKDLGREADMDYV